VNPEQLANASEAPFFSPGDPSHIAQLLRDGNLLCRLETFDLSGNFNGARGPAFLIQSGRLLRKALADETGYLQYAELPEGTYSLISAGSRGFTAFAVNVVPPSKTIPASKSADAGLLNMSLVPPADFPAMMKIVQEQMPSLFRDNRPSGLNRLAFGNPLASGPHFEPSVNLPALLAASTKVKTGPIHRVARTQHDGVLAGELTVFDRRGSLVPAQGTVIFARNGKVVERTRADANGMFRAYDLPPGTYSVFANSPLGFAAFSVQVVGPQGQDARSSDVKTVAYTMNQQQGPSVPTLQGPLTSPSDNPILATALQQQPGNETPPGNQPPGGPAMTGGGGGGGGGRGGPPPGLIGLAGLAGLAGLGGNATPSTK
jgi:hypothetical protein